MEKKLPNQQTRVCSKSRRRRSSSVGHEYRKLETRQLLAGDVPTVFADTSALYQVQTNHGIVAEADLAASTFDRTFLNAGTKIEAAGFRASDGFAYGIVASTGELARTGSNGAVENLGAIQSLPTNEGIAKAGDFADDGLLYVLMSNNLDRLYGVNVDSGAVENTVDLTATLNNVWDIAWSNNHDSFFANKRGPNNHLLKFDLTGTITDIGDTGIKKQTIGAMYADSAGNIFGMHNHGGEVYRFDAVTGTATVVGQVSPTGANDGFSDPSSLLNLVPYAQDDSYVSYGSSISGDVTDGFGGDIGGDGGDVTITQVNGSAGNVGQLITLASGAELTLQADGTFYYDPQDIVAGLVPGEVFEENFTYQVTGSSGNTDAAEVSIFVSNDNVQIDLSEVQGDDGDTDEGFLVFGLDLWEDKTISTADIGDINGDGIVDQIFGVEEANLADIVTGEAYVVFGTLTPEATSKTDKLRSVKGGDGSEGFVLIGNGMNDFTGHSVAGGVDINGDGIGDLVVGARDADSNGNVNNGVAYVFFGRANGYNAEYQLSDLYASNGGDGSDGFVIHGADSHDLFADAVSLGDVNGDGFGDIISCATNADPDGRTNAGEVAVVFGRSSFGAEVDVEDLYAFNGGDGSDGFVIQGGANHDLIGDDVNADGDLNSDGINDLVIGATKANGVTYDSGKVFVVYGSSSFSAEVDLATDTGHSTILGDQHGAEFGTSLSTSGDFNGDGIDDLLIGASHYDVGLTADVGRSYVIYGSNSGLGKQLYASSLSSSAGGNGTSGMIFNGLALNDQAGNAVSFAGDFNNDGFDDIIIGARNADRHGLERTGEVYIVFGNNLSNAEFDLGDLYVANGGNGSEGLYITGRRYFDTTGDMVSEAGDINGDGFDDIVVVSHRVNPFTGKQCFGEAYYIYGFDPTA